MPLTPADKLLLTTIYEDHLQGREIARRVVSYYHDEARAQRTPLYIYQMHLGLLCGIIFQATEDWFPLKGVKPK